MVILLAAVALGGLVWFLHGRTGRRAPAGGDSLAVLARPFEGRTIPEEEIWRGRIVVSGLTKQYPGVTAVDGLSFAVEPGRVTGFLGPNGAGKTTTLRMVLGSSPPPREPPPSAVTATPTWTSPPAGLVASSRPVPRTRAGPGAITCG